MSVNIIKKRIKVFESEMESLNKKINELKKVINELKEGVEADSKGMCNVKGEITFKAFNYESHIEPRGTGKYYKHSLWLDKRFIWEIVRDDWGCACLIITGLNKEEL